MFSVTASRYAVARKEDPALLSGRGRYADDLPVPAGTLHAHVVRSPHPHADIVRIDVAEALAIDGVWAVITGEDVKKLSDPFLVALKSPVHQWSLAVDRVRYVGEPVALVVAESRYLAEDAAELVADRICAARSGDRSARGARAVGAAAASRSQDQRNLGPQIQVRRHQERVREGRPGVKLTVNFHRLSFTPMECYVVVAEHNPADDSYDVLANFQGPFSTHPVMARALRVPGPKMRLRIPPDSGGSFGIKLSVFPYVVLTAIAAKVTGRPVKWVEDRAEHLVSASSGPNRVTEIEAAVTKDGRILALRLDQLEDYGAFLRAPMPGPLYRMHGAVTGAYDIANVDVVNRVVLTNKMPASLIRGFGGPQLYLALERLVQRIAVELGLDHLEVIRRNLVPAEKFPTRAAAGALYDSGDYPRAVETAIGDGRLDDLKSAATRAQAGRKYGIGFAVVVEPAMSNMGYLSTLLTPGGARQGRPEERRDFNGDGQHRSARRGLGDRRCHRAGPGSRTVLSQIVADQLGLRPEDVDVTLEMDTAKDQWSIAAGTYSCRFTPGTAVAAHIGGGRMRRKLKGIGAKQLNVMTDDVDFPPARSGAGATRQRAAVRRVPAPRTGRRGCCPKGMTPALAERGLEPARTRAAVERRPHQRVADLRLRLRHVRHRDRSGHLPGAGRPLRLDARRRHHPQSADRRRPDARRFRAGNRRGALRGIRHQRGRRFLTGSSPTISCRR